MSTQLVPMLALFSPEIMLMIAVAGGVLIFGADKIPKLARSAGQAKKEFLVGQAEADIAAENARAEARKRAEANAAAAAATVTPSTTSVTTPIPDPQTGTTGTSTANPL